MCIIDSRTAECKRGHRVNLEIKKLEKYLQLSCSFVVISVKCSFIRVSNKKTKF